MTELYGSWNPPPSVELTHESWNLSLRSGGDNQRGKTNTIGHEPSFYSPLLTSVYHERYFHSLLLKSKYRSIRFSSIRRIEWFKSLRIESLRTKNYYRSIDVFPLQRPRLREALLTNFHGYSPATRNWNYVVAY